MSARHATVADLPAEFDGVESRILLEALDRTRSRIGLGAWRGDASLGHALLAAHALKRLGYGSNAASGDKPTSVKVGSVSLTRVNGVISSTSHIETTQYGRDYLALRRTLGPAAMAI